jgi:putative aldouronate transport system substrate-binding protein
MKLKQTLGFILPVLILSLGACSKSTTSEGSSSNTPYKVTMTFFSTTTLSDIPLVEAAIKEYLKEKNLEVELLANNISAYQDQVNLMISGGEKLDLVEYLGSTFSNDVAQGKYLPLNDLLKTHGAGAASALGGEYLKAGTIDGKVYGTPSIRDMAVNFGICMRKDIADKYGIKPEDIKTVDDISAVLAKVHAGEPELFITFAQGNTSGIVPELLINWDGLGNDFGVLMNYGQDDELKVVNVFAEKEYEDMLRLVRDWYQKGYIIPDASTNSQTAVTLVGAGQLFSFVSRLKPGFDMQSTRGSGGVEMVTAAVSPPFTTTTQVGVQGWAIPITCKNPEKTMEFLNLLYTDPALVNFIAWGIEGKHYVKLNDRVITYPEGVTAANNGYNLNLTWMFGNSLLAYVWEGNAPDINDQMISFNQNAIVSKALGFQFNAAPVRNAVTAVTNVAAEYRLGLEYGMVDVDVMLPRFIKALEDAGINEIVAEKQRQLDAWLAGN